jgi:signal transduction histidine kinase
MSLSLFRPRGLFVRLVMMFLLISVPVIAGIMYVDVHFSSLRFERDVRGLLVTLEHVPLDTFARTTDVADPLACRELADALFWRVVDEGTTNVSDFDQVLSYFHTGRLHVAIVDGAGVRCGSAPRPTPMLAKVLGDAVQANSPTAFVRDGRDWAMVSSTVLPLAHGARALIGVHFLADWPTPNTTAYDAFRTFLFVAALGAGIAGAMVWLVVRRVRGATQVADRWGAGDLSVRMIDRSKDEFSALATRFNHMADALERSREADRAQVVTAERHRMARDLHDTAKQRSFVLGLKLTELEHRARTHTDLLPTIADTRLLADHLQQDLVNVVSRINNLPSVMELGLRASLARSVDDLLSGSTIAWSLYLPVDVECLLQEWPVMAQELLMMTHEAVANARRHSGCSYVWISAAWQERLTWSIADNGHGFDPAHTRYGMGLNNLRWRADALPEGRLSVESDHTGTRIAISLLPADKPCL